MFQEKYEKKLSDIIKEYFKLNGYQRIGVYGAGWYGKMFLEHAPKEYEYVFFDQTVRKLGGYEVLAPESLEEYTELDVIVFTPFTLETVKYDLMKKTFAEVIALDGIVLVMWAYEENK